MQLSGGAIRLSIQFEVGDHVRWNSEAGYVSGRIIKIHTHEMQYKGHPRHASKEEPRTRSRATRPITSPCTRAPCSTGSIEQHAFRR